MEQQYILIFILLVATLLVGLILLLSLDQEMVIHRLTGGIAIGLVSLALFSAVFSVSSGCLYVKTLGDPRLTLLSYYEAILAGDYAKSHNFLKENTSWALENGASSKEGKLLQKAYEKQLKYQFLGDMVVDQLSATQLVEVTTLDLGKVEARAASLIEGILEERVEVLSRKELYDSQGNYRKELLDEVYLEALSVAILDATECLHKESYVMTLEYAQGEWQVVKADPFLSTNMDQYAENAKITILNNYLADNQVIKKIYTIEEGKLAPRPDANAYGRASAADLSGVLEAIEKAKESGLLEGQKMAFSTESNFYGDIEYYYDETILMILWKEILDGHVYSFCEVKIGDPSQFRRMIADDTYGSGKQYYCTHYAKISNSVVAMNADFYTFRNLGITVYDRTVHRVDHTLDVLMVDQDGKFHFIERGSGMSKEELQSYVDENKIQFSLAFGPVLVKDGEIVPCHGYPIGEAMQVYSRAGIGWMDDLHYLYAEVGHYGDAPVATVNQFAEGFYSKGVYQAYNLDGGQTGEVVSNGKTFNWVDFGYERPVSDIIYFATALPEKE